MGYLQDFKKQHSRIMDITTFSIHQLIGLFLIFLILTGISTEVLRYKLNKDFGRVLLFVSEETSISGKDIIELIVFMLQIILLVILTVEPLLDLMLLIIAVIRDRDWLLGTSLLLMVVSLFQIALYWCIYKLIVFTKSAVMTTNFKDTRSGWGDYYKGISIFFILCLIWLNTEIKVLSLLDLLSVKVGLDELYLMANILFLGIYIISLVCYEKGISKNAQINYL